MAKDILDIAVYLKKLYETIYDNEGEESDLTEMKLHKLLYFAQKRHYANFGEWLFNDDFEGWVHGPVNKKVRRNFHLENDGQELTLDEKYTIREIVYEYGKYSAGVLRNLSHQDSCYKKSRFGLSEYDLGCNIIYKVDIVDDILIDEENFSYESEME
ncbi:Panacea domain-containing protein [Virgibacillus salexigens]|uniref:Panacea domain-containing protein n=1 Tax=Virgibacillus salexigens TaxID=61016 RepID=UPI00190C78D2|nr:type II toxin-antitoxin system antitoxin SocA domain-containing protein [Virgibacillus salexigens]